MTEADANLKRCCGPEGCGHLNDNPYPARWCVGPDCMAWRWRMRQTNEDRTRNMGMWPPEKPLYERTEDGYCGLAGSSS